MCNTDELRALCAAPACCFPHGAAELLTSPAHLKSGPDPWLAVTSSLRGEKPIAWDATCDSKRKPQWTAELRGQRIRMWRAAAASSHTCGAAQSAWLQRSSCRNRRCFVGCAVRRSFLHPAEPLLDRVCSTSSPVAASLTELDEVSPVGTAMQKATEVSAASQRHGKREAGFSEPTKLSSPFGSEWMLSPKVDSEWDR